MMQNGAAPLILPSSPPAAFLQHILSSRAHPTTVLICASKPDFLNATVSELKDWEPPQHPPAKDTGAAPDKRSLLRATLAQVATARHIHTVFVPTVAHLRAYLSVFPPPADTATPGPPPAGFQSAASTGDAREGAGEAQPPALLVYGFLDVHRDGSEWSAQGIGCSAACLVEAAARSGFGAVLMEPRSWDTDGDDAEDEDAVAAAARWAAYEEQIPLIGTTAAMREDGTWGVPCTSARIVLSRWFTFNDS